MTRKELQHAEKIVNHFKQVLDRQQITDIGQEHFDELSLMIEAAISASVLTAQERTADRLSDLAEQIRSRAEHL